MNTAAQSKINYTSLILVAFNVFVSLGYLPAALEPHALDIATAVSAVGASMIVVFRTWFTGN